MWKFLLIMGLISVTKQQTATPYPYLVHICKPGSNASCSGILVSRNKVLTAAHCVSGEKNIDLHFGYSDPNPCWNNSLSINNSQLVNSTFFIIHERFKAVANELFNDIAMIKLPKPINLTSTVTLAHISKVPLSKYTNKNIFINTAVVDSVVKNISVNIGTSANCKAIYKTYFHEGQQGCGLSEESATFDGNGFPLQFNGSLFGFTTLDPLRKTHGFLFVDTHSYSQWINIHSNGIIFNMSMKYFAFYLIIEILALFISK